jgi:pathogenesis-related protein 1
MAHNYTGLSGVIGPMKRILTLPVFFFILLTTTQAQTVPAETGSVVTQQVAQEALNFHNKVRKEVGVGPLVWSAGLAAFAQKWAENLAQKGCKMQHRPYNGEWAQRYGENIYWGKGRAFLPVDASQSWYSEIKDYKHIPVTIKELPSVGHYTQMVWQNTKAVGMGIATCKDGAIIIVANYDPMGNMLGKKAY